MGTGLGKVLKAGKAAAAIVMRARCGWINKTDISLTHTPSNGINGYCCCISFGACNVSTNTN